VKRPLYQALSQLITAIRNCEESDNQEWLTRHTERLTTLVNDHMPSGSGFDAGTRLDTVKSTPEKLVFRVSYHHMHESGMYDGWTEHNVTVRPSLGFGFNLMISGRDRNETKDYMYEVFRAALETEVES